MAYVIISILNSQPGNGHLQDVFEWFEHSCKRDKISLIVAAVMNEKFKQHLINKRDFIEALHDSVIKVSFA